MGPADTTTWARWDTKRKGNWHADEIADLTRAITRGKWNGSTATSYPTSTTMSSKLVIAFSDGAGCSGRDLRRQVGGSGARVRRVYRVLDAHGVEFVVVGAYALAFHGAPCPPPWVRERVELRRDRRLDRGGTWRHWLAGWHVTLGLAAHIVPSRGRGRAPDISPPRWTWPTCSSDSLTSGPKADASVLGCRAQGDVLAT